MTVATRSPDFAALWQHMQSEVLPVSGIECSLSQDQIAIMSRDQTAIM
jgi:hypothetical protein